jgi:hypothetical protein
LRPGGQEEFVRSNSLSVSVHYFIRRILRRAFNAVDAAAPPDASVAAYIPAGAANTPLGQPRMFRNGFPNPTRNMQALAGINLASADGSGV